MEPTNTDSAKHTPTQDLSTIRGSASSEKKKSPEKKGEKSRQSICTAALTNEDHHRGREAFASEVEATEPSPPSSLTTPSPASSRASTTYVSPREDDASDDVVDDGSRAAEKPEISLPKNSKVDGSTAPAEKPDASRQVAPKKGHPGTTAAISETTATTVEATASAASATGPAQVAPSTRFPSLLDVSTRLKSNVASGSSAPVSTASHPAAPPQCLPSSAGPSSPSAPPSTAPPPPRTHYQYMHSFDYRARLATRMRTLYGTDTIPVIVEPAECHVRLSTSPSLRCDAAPTAAASSFSITSTTTAHGPAGSSIGQALHRCTGHIRSSLGQGSPSPSSSPCTASALATPSSRSTLKCVLPSSKSVAEVILTLRDRLALDSCQSIFLSVGESEALVPGNSLLGDLYERFQNPDGFLYLSYLLENTFGGR